MPVDLGPGRRPAPAAEPDRPPLLRHGHRGRSSSSLRRDGDDVRGRDRLRPEDVLRGPARRRVSPRCCSRPSASARSTPGLAARRGGLHRRTGYPLVFSARPEGTGPALVRGTAYGFLWWVVVEPDPGAALATAASTGPSDRRGGRGPAAAVPAARRRDRGRSSSGWAALARGLFVDDVRARCTHGPAPAACAPSGTARWPGSSAGSLFALRVMEPWRRCPPWPAWSGHDGAVAGWIVHLVIALLIGVSYAMLFRGSSFDLTSGIGWGVSYGFFWWVLGALTLLPVLLGQPRRWNAAATGRGLSRASSGTSPMAAALGAVLRVAGAAGESVVGDAQPRRSRTGHRPARADPRLGARALDPDRPHRPDHAGAGGRAVRLVASAEAGGFAFDG